MSDYSFSLEEVASVWEQLTAELHPKLSPAVFNTWILSNPLQQLEIEGESAYASFMCPTAFHASTLKKNLSTIIKQHLDGLLAKDVILDFKIGTPSVPKSTANFSNQPESVVNAVPSTPVQTNLPPAAMPLQNIINRPSFVAGNNLGNFNTNQPAIPTHQPGTRPSNPRPQGTQTSHAPSSPRVEDLFSANTIQSMAVDRAAVVSRQVGLRSDYTFETFAVSTTNEMAHAAATAVSNQPGVAYNPLFLYGGVGVGKTHLMQAIGNNILKNNPDTRMIYCTGEEFTNDIVNAIQMKKAIKFKEKYRAAHVLLMDDIQFIAGKNAVQEEFFHTFNALIKQASQIILTSDRPPQEINLLEDRLRSRFEAGLMIDIQQPSFELRTAILLIKANANNMEIPMDLAQVIASRVDSARKIEGIITRLRSAVELQKRPLSMELVEDLLRTEIDTSRPTLKVNPNDVLRAVSNHYHVKQAALKGPQRIAELVKARHIAMYILKEDLHLPFTEIGKWFSNRDHTSAMHAVKKITDQMLADEVLRRDVSALRMSLTAVSR
jgi:chromosomal replication initiator protein